MRPLGFWLLHVHRGLEDRMNALLAERGLTRRHWQVLNTVVTTPGSRADVGAALATFRGADGPSATEVVDDLIARGWLVDGDPLVVTAAGVAAHADAAAAVGRYRDDVLAGVPAEDLSALDRTLERVAANLDRMASA